MGISGKRSFIYIVVLLAFGITLMSFSKQGKETIHDLETQSFVSEIPQNNRTLFDIPVGDYSLFQDKIQPNQFLSDLLLEHNVEYSKIHRLVQNSKDIFDVKGIKAGRPFSILCSDENVPTADYFIYEHNPTEYVVFDLRGEPKVEVKQRNITKLTSSAGGIIESSLYLTLEELNLSPKLAVELSEIYAWSIDFFRINSGDEFKVIYEDKYADGEYIGVGEIKAAYFKHYGQDYYAIYFENGDLGDYYDEKANKMRKAFLRAPLKFSRISSGYSGRRFHPVLKRYKAHLGTDYAAPKGTPIMATANGTIIRAKYNKNNGNYVKIKHNSVYTTQYLHMSKIAKGISSGARVKQGQVIGYVGSTGLATGPHVCYRFWKNGKQVNPYKQKLPAAEPIKKEDKAIYLEYKKSFIERLNNIEAKSTETQESETVGPIL